MSPTTRRLPTLLGLFLIGLTNGGKATLDDIHGALEHLPHLNSLVQAGPLPLEPKYRSPCWTAHVDRDTGGNGGSSGPKTTLCLPYLYLAGFPKCSTSTLFFEISNSHPLIAPSCEGFRFKEPQWLTRNPGNRSLESHLDWTFARCKSRGEVAPLQRVAKSPQTIFVDGSV